MSEKLTDQMVDIEPQKVSDRVAEMLQDGRLTKLEREELLAVLDKMKASKNEIIQNSIKNLKDFAQKNGYVGFKAKLESEANISNTVSEQQKVDPLPTTSTAKYEDLPLRQETAQDYGLPEGSDATFLSVINDKGEGLLKKYKENPNNLSKQEKLTLAKYLVAKSQDSGNSSFYMVDEYILAAQLNPKEYRELAKNEILRHVTNSGWSRDVVGNLGKIGLGIEEIKREVLKITSAIKPPYKSGLTIGIEATIPVLVQLGLTQELNRLQKIVENLSSQGNYYPLNDFLRERGIHEEYGDILEGSGRGGYYRDGFGVVDFKIKRNGEVYTVIYIDKDHKKEIKGEDVSSNESHNFLEQYRGELVDELKKEGKNALSQKAIKLAYTDKREYKLVLQALFELRGATRAEANQQLELDQNYGIHTIVTENGELDMLKQGVKPEIVESILRYKKDLLPRVKKYLERYLKDNTI